MSLLEVRNLTTQLDTPMGEVLAVDDVTLEIKNGETLGLVGESGSGKTLTALSLMRLIPAQAGRIVGGRVLFDGRDVREMSNKELQHITGNRMAMIFQDPMTALNPLLRVSVQISEVLEVHRGMKRGQARKRAIELLELVGIPAAEKRVDGYPHEFSGGMRQRISIAMALACQPQLLIADEVTTALDVTIQSQVLELLQQLSAELGMAMLLITHDLGIIAGMTHRVNVMYASQIVEQADTAELFENPRMPYTWGLLRSLPRIDGNRWKPLIPIEGRPPDHGSALPGCRFEPRCPHRREICRTKPPDLLSLPGVSATHTSRCWGTQDVPGGGWLMDIGWRTATQSTGRQAPSALSGLAPQAGEKDLHPARPLLEVRGLNVHFSPRKRLLSRRDAGVVRAVDGLDISLRPGETLGLVGESGSGKTTTCRAILQLNQPTAGSIKFRGEELIGLKGTDLRSTRRQMQMVFQDPYSSLDRRMTIGRIVAEPLEVHGLGSTRKNAARVEHLLELVGVDPRSVSRYPHEFSGGQRQRIAVARALALEPDLIIADEPVSALDVSVQAQVLNLLKKLQGEFDLTYLFVAHDLAVVRYISDRVAVMYLGKIIELADCHDLYDHPMHPYTQALMSAAPIPDPKIEARRQRIILRSDVPDPADPPTGCRFHPRCQLRVKLGNPEVCSSVEPTLVEKTTRHWTACHFTDDSENMASSMRLDLAIQ